MAHAGCTEWDKYWEGDPPPTGPVLPTDTAAPTVTVQSPSGADAAQATPVSGADYAVVVEARDDVGVRSILVQVDGGPAVEVYASPQAAETRVLAEMSWDTTALDEGSTHDVSATAVDAAGNQGTSEPAFAQVFNEGPVVAVSEPSADALVRGTVPFTVSFPDGDQIVDQVEFLAGVWSIAVVTGPPWTTQLDTSTLPDGQHYLAAKATTTLGSIGVSDAVAVHVNNGSPVVTIDFPPDGHAVATRGTLVLEATATDSQEGTIPGPRITWRSSVDGALGTGTQVRRSGLTVGTHTMTATVTNAWGTPDSASIQVSVMQNPTYGYCTGVQRDLFTYYLCSYCHEPAYPDFQESRLDLESYAGLMAGGITTLFEIVYPCRPESSLIYNKVTEPVPWVGNPMPNDPAFPTPPPAVLDKLRVWILEGAPPDEPPDCP
jgi:hypothetical protein